ncbi:MAG: hypothetical protein IJ806_01310 [Ruminococcus sp.]|nr:hypothetical protein [Ruminococcus sp.]
MKKRVEKDAAYICTTPFQLMSAVTLAVSNGETADVFIDPQFRENEKYIKRLRKTGVFERVTDLGRDTGAVRARNVKNKYLRGLRIKLIHLNIKGAFRKSLGGHRYKKLYTSNNSYFFDLMMRYFLAVDARPQVVFFDDGEGSYDNPKCRIPNKKYVSKDSVTVKYLYSPELYLKMNGRNNREDIRPLPLMDHDKRVRKAIDLIFDTKKIPVVGEPLMILDTMRETCMDEKTAKDYSETLFKVCEKIGKNNVCIKQHPRDKSDTWKGYNIYPDSSVPFELLCMTSDVDKKVIITLSSTAVMMPKILFGKEPVIILLYKLFKMKIADDGGRDKIYKQLRNIYQNKKRVLIPETQEELFSYLDELGKRRGR